MLALVLRANPQLNIQSFFPKFVFMLIAIILLKFVCVFGTYSADTRTKFISTPS